VAEKMTDPDDFWAVAKLDDMLADDGGVDPDKVGAELDRVLAAKPHWGRAEEKPPVDLHQGARQSVDDRTPSFGEALKRGGRR
jgi:hypothetical protein